MIILTIRTDKPESELGLYDDGTQLAYETWEAHRQLGETIHLKLKELLEAQELELKDIGGIVAYEGPGSFTGLRIGLSVANALAYALRIPIVALHGGGWQEQGVDKIRSGNHAKIALPDYGAPVRITQPKK